MVAAKGFCGRTLSLLMLLVEGAFRGPVLHIWGSTAIATERNLERSWSIRFSFECGGNFLLSVGISIACLSEGDRYRSLI